MSGDGGVSYGRDGFITTLREIFGKEKTANEVIQLCWELKHKVRFLEEGIPPAMMSGFIGSLSKTLSINNDLPLDQKMYAIADAVERLVMETKKP